MQSNNTEYTTRQKTNIQLADSTDWQIEWLTDHMSNSWLLTPYQMLMSIVTFVYHCMKCWGLFIALWHQYVQLIKQYLRTSACCVALSLAWKIRKRRKLSHQKFYRGPRHKDSSETSKRGDQQFGHMRRWIPGNVINKNTFIHVIQSKYWYM